MSRYFTTLLILTCCFLLIHTPLIGQESSAKPRILLIGDSTVKNGSGKGDGGLWGWGQVIDQFLDTTQVIIDNQALGGRSSRSYLTEGLWEKAKQPLKKGDIVLIQFGHNDGGDMFKGTRPRASIKGNGEESKDGVVEQTGKSETVHSYGWYLRKYIADTQAKGATAIVLSPVPRNMWNEGKVGRASKDYGKWAKEAAQQSHALFIDLNELCAAKMESLGQEKVASEFFTPADHTHTTKPGAVFFASCVAQGLKELTNSPAAPFLKLTGTTTTLWKFQLAGEKPIPDHIRISADSKYNFNTGYGFLTPVQNQSSLGNSQSLLSVRLPEGTYQVKVRLGNPQEKSATTIKAESRRLQINHLELNADETKEVTFNVHVRIPTISPENKVKLKDRETKTYTWDDQLTLEILGNHPAVQTIEITPITGLTTIFLAGDSTVADQANEPWNSWGQMLPVFMNDQVVVANYAESGESIKSSLSAQRFEKIFSQMKPGDYLLIQFGHNDMKDKAPDALEKYKANLEKLVERTRSLQGNPILITSMERKAGVTNPTLGNYPQTVRDVAQQMHVPLIDLNKMSITLYQALGDKLEKAFQDGTHHNNYGSYLLAHCIVAGLKQIESPLAKFVLPQALPFDPAKPDSLESFQVPPSLNTDLEKPLGN